MKKIKTVKSYIQMKKWDGEELKDTGERLLNEEIYYDERGNIIELITYKGGEINTHIRYDYDDKNMLKGDIILDEGEEVEKKIYFYEGDKLVKEIRKFMEGEDELLYVYNSRGQLTAKIVKDNEGNIEKKDVYEYCEDRLISKVEYEENENKVKEERYEYNDKGLLSRYIIINYIENYEERRDYFYYDNDLRKERKIYIAGKLVGKDEYYYDDKNRLNKSREIKDGIMRSRLYEYNERGNIIYEEERVGEDKILMSIERAFDDDNNLREVSVYENNYNYGIDNYYDIIMEYEYWD